ncbi:MAG: hypothetical protein JRH01_26120, partial [Deltaproteobacteria bacterium]|nr:hypothetical protein [Deltaproteobacteria bacterium]
MKVFTFCVVLVVVAVMAWQHVRYVRARRGPNQDKQRQLYAGSAFHVLTFLRVPAGGDVLDSMRKLRSDLEGGGQAEMVYAGRVALIGLASSQLPETDWDAVVLVQYPSRASFDAVAESAAYRASLERFAETFSQGLDRPVALNLAIPQFLLAVRVYELVTGKGSHYPFVPAAGEVGADGEDAQGARLATL